MNKTLAAAIAVAMSSGSAFAAADGPIDGKVYGKINATYQMNDNEVKDSTYKLESNASRLGFGGATELDGGISAIYQIEYEVYADDGTDDKADSHALNQRNTYVGLKGGFGQVLAGKYDTPLKAAQGKFDLFNDLSGDIKAVIEGENRQNNIVQYSSPKLGGGIVATLAIVPGEEQGTDGADLGTEVDADGPADSISGSIAYDTNGLYLALAMDSDVVDQDIIRLVASYTMGDITLAGLYQNAEESEDGETYANGKEEADSMGVSLAYKMGSNTLKFQYIDSDSNEKVSEGEQMSLGFDHALGKATTVFAFYTAQDSEADASQETFVGVGMEHKF